MRILQHGLRVASGLTVLAVAPMTAAATQVAPTPGAAAAMVPSPAAVIAAMPKNLPRAEGPKLADAIAAAQAADTACRAKNVQVSVLIADTVGRPVVLLSGDGAGYRSQLIAQTKANIVAKYGRPSGDIADAAKSDPSLTAAAAADPTIGELRGGGFPVRRNGKMIGIVAVSGGTLGGVMGLDELCAHVAVAKLESR